MTKARALVTVAVCVVVSVTTGASSVPIRAQRGMVASQSEIASRIGANMISAGGTAVDAAVATAFALAVVHPTAGNIGGGGFIVYRPAKGDPVAQEAIDAPRFHHQWLPDRLDYEKYGLSPDTTAELERRGHTLRVGGGQGVAQVIVFNTKEDMLEAARIGGRRMAPPSAFPDGPRHGRQRRASRSKAPVVDYPRALTRRGALPLRPVGACFSSRSMNSMT
jgi:gamma-glutamyltranspeptidase